MNKAIIKEIKNKDFLKRVFAFKSDEEADLLCMFENEMKKYSDIEWLYLSYNKYAKLIGIMKEGFIFKIDEDLDTDIFCISFFDIPFSFFRLSVIEAGLPEIDTLVKNDLYREDLRKYLDWCNINKYNIEERDFKLLKDSIDKLNSNGG